MSLKRDYINNIMPLAMLCGALGLNAEAENLIIECGKEVFHDDPDKYVGLAYAMAISGTLRGIERAEIMLDRYTKEMDGHDAPEVIQLRAEIERIKKKLIES